MAGGIAYGLVFPDCRSDLKANGGSGSIAEQLAASSIDILLGGGRKYFNQSPGDVGGATVFLQAAKDEGFQVFTDFVDLITADTASPVLGLFAPGELPVSLMGEGDRKAEKIGVSADGRAELAEPFSCVSNPRFDEVPSLLEMTRAAIDYLQKSATNGFLLVVESSE